MKYFYDTGLADARRVKSYSRVMLFSSRAIDTFNRILIHNLLRQIVLWASDANFPTEWPHLKTVNSIHLLRSKAFISSISFQMMPKLPIEDDNSVQDTFSTPSLSLTLRIY